jgi:hypothetical protein
MSKTIFTPALLSAATILAAGLATFPDLVQEAQANPETDDSEEIDSDIECEFYGADIEEYGHKCYSLPFLN